MPARPETFGCNQERQSSAPEETFRDSNAVIHVMLQPPAFQHMKIEDLKFESLAEDVRDELRTELVLLNGALKQLNPDLDFSDALRPLLADTGPALAHTQRLAKHFFRKKYGSV
jgi:hypothetical protein